MSFLCSAPSRDFLLEKVMNPRREDSQQQVQRSPVEDKQHLIPTGKPMTEEALSLHKQLRVRSEHLHYQWVTRGD